MSGREEILNNITNDLNENPINTKNILFILDDIYNGLCKFVPSKKNIHQKIKKDLLSDEINYDTMPKLILALINWIKKFQAPVYDKITDKWIKDFKNTNNYSTFIQQFLIEYYQHVEKCYKEVWEARKRLLNNESVVPEEHRPKGKNGIPDKIRSGF